MDFGFCPDPFGEGWKQTAALLGPALTRSGHDWPELLEALEARKAQLWLVKVSGEPIAALVTCKAGDTLEIWLAGGRILAVLPFLEQIEASARIGGMTNGRVNGRKGWARVLRPLGWRVSGSWVVKDFG